MKTKVIVVIITISLYAIAVAFDSKLFLRLTIGALIVGFIVGVEQ